MKQGEYESVEQMEEDLNLMLENAKRYNMPTSGIYKRALRLQQILQVLTFSFLCDADHAYTLLLLLRNRDFLMLGSAFS